MISSWRVRYWNPQEPNCNSKRNMTTLTVRQDKAPLIDYELKNLWNLEQKCVSYCSCPSANTSQKYLGYLETWRFVHFVCFCFFTSQVNSYGHGGTVSSPNHTFFLGKLEQAVNQYFVHILSLVTDNNPSWMIQGKGGEWPEKLFHNQSPRKYGTGPVSN